jgi:hypothetical protein
MATILDTDDPGKAIEQDQEPKKRGERENRGMFTEAAESPEKMLIETMRSYQEKFEEIEKEIEELKEKLDRIVMDLDNDRRQPLKRFVSYCVLDGFVEMCWNGHCPDLTKDARILYLLVDISIHKYIEEKAYFYSLAGEGKSDSDRFEKASERIEHILKCSNKQPSIDPYLINQDTAEVRGAHSASARRRKAYWSFLHRQVHYQPDNNHYSDYCGACGFVENLHSLSSKKRCTPGDLEKAKQIVNGNRHMANGIDLFRPCVMRRNM